jgi:hypothetical protein
MDDLKKSPEELSDDFDIWFKEQQPEGEEKDADTLANQAKLRGSVGGVTGIVSILAGVSDNSIARDSAISILEEIYGLSNEAAIAMIGPESTEPKAGEE